MLINVRLLSAWPNYLTIPVILAFWVVIGLLGSELLTGSPSLKPTESAQ